MAQSSWIEQIKTHRTAALIGLLFLTLALTYSIIIPPFEISDETRHFAVVKYMADTGKLPVQGPGEAQPHWDHQGNQPPLYYALAVLLTGWIETGAWDDVYWYNPHTSGGVPVRTDNENMTIHTEREAFPWRGYTLVIHLIRFMSIGMALVTIIFVYLIALNLFKGDRWLAANSMALAAFIPMFIFISSGIANDNLVAMLSAIAIWLLLKIARRSSSLGYVVFLGLIIGLGALSKLYAVGLLGLAGLLFLQQGYAGRNWRNFWRRSLILGVVVFLVAGWWYIRNYLLYDDFLALEPMRDAAGRRDVPFTWSVFISEFEGFRIAYWALFGGTNILVHNWIYRTLDAISLIAMLSLIAFGVAWLWRKKFPLPERISRDTLLILLAWVGIMTLGFVIWNLEILSSQGWMFYSAIGALASLMVLALSWPLPQKYAPWPATIFAGALFIFAALSPWVYIVPAYSKPPLLTIADVPGDITPLNYTFNDEIRLIGVKINKNTVRATETLPLTAYWEILKPVPVNYSVFAHAYGRGGAAMGQFDTYPGLGAWPTTTLAPGDVVADTYPIPIFPLAEEGAPARLQLAVGLYEFDEPGFPRPPVTDGAGQALENTFVGQAKLVPWQWPNSAPTYPLAIDFEDGITLTGYDSTCPAQTGPCALTLYWAAAHNPAGNYQVFIQLWRGDEQIAGFDGPPVGGDYPSYMWAAGERIIDSHQITLPANLSQDDYRFRVGLYSLDTGRRLSAAAAGGPLPDFAVDLPLSEKYPIQTRGR